MTWQEFIRGEMEKPYFRELSKFLAKEAKSHTIYPPKERIFAAFDYCPLEKVKCVILGMDPYINSNEAVGLCFSVPKGVAIPPSLRNIFKELQTDLGIEPPKHGCLESWGRSGILLLNSILTVRAGASGSHRGHGWETLTDAAIRLINDQPQPVVYLLWGRDARAKKPLITNPKHLVLESMHPSPLSSRGFFGNRHFSQANEFLAKNGISPIDWRV